MTEETKAQSQEPQGQSEETTTGAGRDPQLERNLSEELNRLGQSFVEVVKVAWNSDQRRQLEQDLAKGINSLAANLEEGLKKVGESQQAKELMTRAEGVAESVAERMRTSEVSQEVGEGLLKGLRSLSTQLEKLTNELQTKQAAKSGSTPPGEQAQDIPIEKE
ncbi:MAG: hypothetical protein DCC55_01810 [Chloroflexi bacterium]|nr:MAG: hypothetical protein DCC55_01810 [Chloroflexota bacterium]